MWARLIRRLLGLALDNVYSNVCWHCKRINRNIKTATVVDVAAAVATGVVVVCYSDYLQFI